MFKASSITNTIIVLSPILLGVTATIAVVLQYSQPLEIVFFYSVVGMISVSLMIYAKYPTIVNGRYASFGLTSIHKKRRWAYITSYAVLVFLVAVSMLTIRLVS